MSNSTYWAKRFETLEQSQSKQGLETYQDVEKQFRQAQRTLEAQISAWYQRFAENNHITLQEAKKLLTTKELEEFKWDVEEYIQYGKENKVSGEWEKQLENASARYHISRLDSLKIQLQQGIEKAFGNELDAVDDMIRSVYKEGYYKTIFEIQKGVSIGSDFAKLDESKISKLMSKPWAADGKDFSSRIWSNKDKLVNELNTTLTQNIILGRDPQKAIDEIARKMKASKNQAGALVMTEQAFFSSSAQKDAFNELDVEKYEIVATLDLKTSNICQEMDKKVFPMKDYVVGTTAPPFHVRCRTTTCPYFDDDFGLVGERAARGEDGKTYYVPADMTYKEWKETYVDGVDKSDIEQITPDIKFATKQGSSITAKQKFKDMMTVSIAHTELPQKVQQNLSDVVFEFGYNGSACDISNKIIRVGIGVSKEDMFHEYGHLIEKYLLNSTDVTKYKKYLVDSLSYSDIMIDTYYDSVGNGVDIFLLKGNRFESEYQSRLYVSDVMEALNLDGTINVDVLGETISEPFRKYMTGEDISDEIKNLIEGVVL